jgi:hypothetical protein
MSDRPHEGKPPSVRRTVPPAIADRSGSWLRMVDMGARDDEVLLGTMVRPGERGRNWQRDERRERDDEVSQARNGREPAVKICVTSRRP